MGWRADGGLWLLVRGGGLFLSKGSGVCKLILPFLVHYDGIQVQRSVFTSFLSLHFLGELLLFEPETFLLLYLLHIKLFSWKISLFLFCKYNKTSIL